MGSESSNQECQSKSLQIPEARQPMNGTSGNNTMNPICKLSPNYKGSALYDSYELQAVVQQLNKAIQGSKAFSPIGLKSPFHQKRLNCVSGENRNKSPKRLTGSRFSSATTMGSDKNGNRGAWVVTKLVVTRLWMKVKKGLMGNKHKE